MLYSFIVTTLFADWLIVLVCLNGHLSLYPSLLLVGWLLSSHSVIALSASKRREQKEKDEASFDLWKKRWMCAAPLLLSLLISIIISHKIYTEVVYFLSLYIIYFIFYTRSVYSFLLVFSRFFSFLLTLFNSFSYLSDVLQSCAFPSAVSPTA